MAGLFLYIMCLPEMWSLQGNRLTPEHWGLRNPPGGKCSNRQEVSWSRAVRLTHRDSESPAQPISFLEQPLGLQMYAEDRQGPT